MAQFIVNDDEVVRFKDELARLYRDEICVKEILPLMREEAPIDKGLLRQSHSVDHVRVQSTGGGYLITFRATAPYAVIVGLGHGIIRPVRAKVLRFVTKTGVVVYTKKVRAVPGNNWMFRAFKRAGLRDVHQGR